MEFEGDFGGRWETEKNTIVIYSKYYSVSQPYYSKVYYTVYIIVFTTIC